MSDEHTPIPVAAPHTPEWYAARETSIGASEIAVAAGLSPYATPLELYQRKKGLIGPLEDNDAMRLGRLLEPVVKAEYCHRSGAVLIDSNPPMYRHPTHIGIVATPDGIISSAELLECKTTSWRMKSYWGDPESDQIPDQYLCQAQAQLAVMAADVCHVACLFDGAVLKTYRVMRNDELIEMLIGSAVELLQRIADKRPPEPNWEHPSTPALIRSMHQSIDDTRIELSSDEVAFWTRYEVLGETITEMEKEREVCKAKVIHAIGENYAGLLGDGRMIRRKLIEKKPFTSTPKPYIDVRCVKADGGPVVARGDS